MTWKATGDPPLYCSSKDCLICHGLEAASADPGDDREPFIRCRAIDGAEQIYTYNDLQAAIRTLERFNAGVTD